MAMVQLSTGAYISSDREEIINQYLQNGGRLVPDVVEEAPKPKQAEKKIAEKKVVEKQPSKQNNKKSNKKEN